MGIKGYGVYMVLPDGTEYLLAWFQSNTDLPNIMKVSEDALKREALWWVDRYLCKKYLRPEEVVIKPLEIKGV